MSDLQTLMDMGFTSERASRALAVTNGQGVEQAMEWLLAHADESIPTEQVAEPNSGTLVLSPVTAAADDAAGASTSEAVDESAIAKSFKCNECNRLFTTQMEIEFHAAKSGHSSFSESNEEKKPLTEEEKKEQLAKLEEKLKSKRLERENREKVDELEREKLRIKSGKDMSEARRRMEELEMQKVVEQRKREKADEKLARDRVKAQIEADKAARKARLAADMGQSPPAAPLTPIAKPQTASSSPGSKLPNYTHTKIQIRLQNGSTLTETFDVKEQLSAVRLFVQLKQENSIPFGLMTSFPRKVFTDEDYDKPLEVLGLVPSAVVIQTKV